MLKEIIIKLPMPGYKWYNIQVQKGQRSSVRFNSTNTTPRHIITKLSKIKDKEKTLKEKKRKETTIIGCIKK
jgi:hypothetical protein